MRGDPIAAAKYYALRKVCHVHGNTKPAPRQKMPDFDALFAPFARRPKYTVETLCSSCAMSRAQARAYFKSALRAKDFPESTEDVFIDAARNGMSVPEKPWNETLYPFSEAAVVFTKSTGRKASRLRAAINNGDLPVYKFSQGCVRIRREDLQAFILATMRKKGVLIPCP